MFADKSLLFSPWFRLIANRWMIGNKDSSNGGWWDDLKCTMDTDVFCDYENIHRFDPPVEHMGGGGDAGPMFAGENATIKGGLANATVGDAS